MSHVELSIEKRGCAMRGNGLLTTGQVSVVGFDPKSPFPCDSVFAGTSVTPQFLPTVPQASCLNQRKEEHCLRGFDLSSTEKKQLQYDY